LTQGHLANVHCCCHFDLLLSMMAGYKELIFPAPSMILRRSWPQLLLLSLSVVEETLVALMKEASPREQRQQRQQ